jgi:SAM-dependent methyltransferase
MSHADNESSALPILYRDLAPWWPLLSSPDDYAEEAGIYVREIIKAADGPVRTVLELGSGGGNNASHMKRHFQMTLVDLSPGMLKVSHALNPECEHRVGDMRSVRLNCQFDAVFVQDAVSYMTTEQDLGQAFTTAAIHCRPGGVALFAPDYVRETFQPSCSHGGHDGDGCGLRYLEWHWDPDPDDTTTVSDMVYLLREGDQTRCVHERHHIGLFPRHTWIRLLERAGFIAEAVPFEHSELPSGSTDLFVARKAR